MGCRTLEFLKSFCLFWPTKPNPSRQLAKGQWRHFNRRWPFDERAAKQQPVCVRENQVSWLIATTSQR
ncbi:hypothetical protein VTI28DRAFT_3865 [Corynascus sepedonium]